MMNLMIKTDLDQPDTTEPGTPERDARLYAEMLRGEVAVKYERFARRVRLRMRPKNDKERKVFAARDSNAKSAIRRAMLWANVATKSANAAMRAAAMARETRLNANIALLGPLA